MLTVADMGEGDVKNHGYSADVLYGRSHRLKPNEYYLCQFLKNVSFASKFYGMPFDADAVFGFWS